MLSGIHDREPVNLIRAKTSNLLALMLASPLHLSFPLPLGRPCMASAT